MSVGHGRLLHETYEVVTPDGWTLVIDRTRAAEADSNSALGGVPVLLVHGLSQNRHVYTTGSFVDLLAAEGADCHILELRGHGRSSIALQKEKARAGVRQLPEDWLYGWDFSAYYLRDVPAAIDAVKERTGRERIAYCGHSMGGIIGYGLAGKRDDLLCLATLGSPLRVASDGLLWRALAHVEPVLHPLSHATVGTAVRSLFRLRRALRRGGRGAAARKRKRQKMPDVVPFELIIGGLYRAMLAPHPAVGRMLPPGLRLFGRGVGSHEEALRMLEVGEDNEPAAVLSTFARWTRGEPAGCSESGDDFGDALAETEVPALLVYGTDDPLAGRNSTRPAYEAVKGRSVRWVCVRGAGHLDLTLAPAAEQVVAEITRLVGAARR